ncbi:unnamed protein product [Heterosigma akashiwo]|mmetsp:Transcript_34145/g.59361  ORF Transcript_34145/g.59361 Transcript_34145/m.59361 type:complete len:161 (-) Transcript_34145:456-938(-)
MEAKGLALSSASAGRRTPGMARVGTAEASLNGTGSGFNMKAKIASLEQRATDHDTEFESVYKELGALEAAAQGDRGAAAALVEASADKLGAELNALKDEMVHRFTLQSAENKRLQNHITSLKQENQALERRLFALEERCKRLEIEVGGGEEDDEFASRNL